MKYAMCPKCGRRLCKGENGTKVEMECPKCGEFASVIIEEDDISLQNLLWRFLFLTFCGGFFLCACVTEYPTEEQFYIFAAPGRSAVPILLPASRKASIN